MGAAMVTAVPSVAGLAMQPADLRHANSMAANPSFAGDGSAPANGSFAQQLSQHSQARADDTAPASRNAKPAGALAKSTGTANTPCDDEAKTCAAAQASDTPGVEAGVTTAAAGVASVANPGADPQTPVLTQTPAPDTVALAHWIAGLLPTAQPGAGVPGGPMQAATPDAAKPADSTTTATVQTDALASTSDPRTTPMRRGPATVNTEQRSAALQATADAVAAQPMGNATTATVQPTASAATGDPRALPARSGPAAGRSSALSTAPALATADPLPPLASSPAAAGESTTEAPPSSALPSPSPADRPLQATPTATDTPPAIAAMPQPAPPLAVAAAPSSENRPAPRGEAPSVRAISNVIGNVRVDRGAASVEQDTGPMSNGKAAPVAAPKEASAPGEHVLAGPDAPISHAPAFSHLLDAATQALAAAPPTSAGNQAAPTTAAVDVNLPTPVMSPEFREALGVQVSVLARDGVQHAELHLNPTDMGPISVRIALDGTQAQVDFGVDTAATRALVESGLPELASALREAGLTLTGGGVSQHARGQSADGWGSRQGDGSAPGQGGSGRQRGATGEDDASPLPRPRTMRVAGGVDLYA